MNIAIPPLDKSGMQLAHDRECLNQNKEVRPSSRHAAVDCAAAVTDARKLKR